MNHTPGPWTNNGLKDMGCFQVVDSHGWLLADVYFKTTFRENVEEAEQNATLIATAPELLSTLKDLLTWDDGNLPGDLIDAARNAIAKAEGKG